MMVKFHYNAHNSHPPVPNHSEIYPVYAFHPNLLEPAKLIYKRLSSKFCLPADIQTKILSIFLAFPVPAISPAHFIIFYSATLMMSGEKIQHIIQICIFCITRNNFLPTYAKYRRATPCRLYATFQSTHSQPPSVSEARLPAQPEDLSCRCNMGSTEHGMT